MIITFLWMLYLAFTLFCTAITISSMFDNKPPSNIKTETIGYIITCLLWSIWYFYYLN